MEDVWEHLIEDGLWIPVLAVPKQRPQVGKNGAYYGDRYTQFRKDVVQACADHKLLNVGIDYPVLMEILFTTDGFWVQLRKLVVSSKQSFFTKQVEEIPDEDADETKSSGKKSTGTPSTDSTDLIPARPTHVRGDIDNLVGGVLDALQDAGVIEDDKWVWELHARIWRAI